jgi:hypothetical protein
VLAEELIGTRTQLGELNVPDPLLLKLTMPVGGIGVPGPVSVTVAVQLVGTFTATVPGLQLTVVLVGRWMTVIVVLPWLPK